MKEYTTQLGHKIYLFENVIPTDICEKLISEMPKKGIAYMNDKGPLPKYLYELYTTYCNPSPVKFVGYVQMLSCGASDIPIGIHSDPITSNLDNWKVFIYLNNVVNGGTIFREGGEDVLIENSEGSVVLFDIRIPHLGNPNQQGMKYTIGFRPIASVEDRFRISPLYSRFKRH